MKKYLLILVAMASIVSGCAPKKQMFSHEGYFIDFTRGLTTVSSSLKATRSASSISLSE